MILKRKMAIVLSILLVFMSFSSIGFASSPSDASKPLIDAVANNFRDTINKLEKNEYNTFINVLEKHSQSQAIADAAYDEINGTPLATTLFNAGIDKEGIKSLLDGIKSSTTTSEMIVVADQLHDYVNDSSADISTSLTVMTKIIDKAYEAGSESAEMLNELENHMKADKKDETITFLVSLVSEMNDNFKWTRPSTGGSWTAKYDSDFNNSIMGVFNDYTTIPVTDADMYTLRSAFGEIQSEFYASLSANQSDFNKLEPILIKAGKLELISSGGGSSSGGSGGGGGGNDSASDKADKLADNIEKKSAKQATKAVSDFINKDMNKLFKDKDLDIEEATKAVDAVLDSVDNILDKDDMSNAEAKSLAKQVISDVVGKILDQDDMTDKDIKKVTEKAVALVEKAVAKAGDFDEEKITLKGTKATVDKNAMKKAIKDLELMTKDLAKELKDAGIKDVELNKTLVVAAPSKAEDMELPVSVIKDMAKKGMNVALQFEGAKFVIPANVAALAGDDLQVTVKKTDKKANAKDFKDLGLTFEFDLKTDGDKVGAFTNKPSITITLGNAKADTSKLGVYIVTNDGLEYVPAKVDGKNIVFEAPHFSTYTVLEFNKVFADTYGHWAKSDIEQMAMRQIAKGIDEKNFGPNNTVTRAQFAVLLVRTLGLEGTGRTQFADIDANEWFANEVSLAADKGIVSGVGASKFAPNSDITREQMVVMIARAYKVMTGEDLTGKDIKFADNAEINSWAVKAVEGAVNKSIIKGYSEDNTFRPSASATRAQGIVMLKRLLEQ